MSLPPIVAYPRKTVPYPPLNPAGIKFDKSIADRAFHDFWTAEARFENQIPAWESFKADIKEWFGGRTWTNEEQDNILQLKKNHDDLVKQWNDTSPDDSIARTNLAVQMDFLANNWAPKVLKHTSSATEITGEAVTDSVRIAKEIGSAVGNAIPGIANSLVFTGFILGVIYIIVNKK